MTAAGADLLPSTVVRIRALIAAAPVLLALVGSAACNPGRPPAATVGSTDISAQRLDEVLGAYVEGAPDLYRSQVEGQGEDTYQMGAANAILNGLVLQVLQAELAEDAGEVPSEEDVAEARQLVQAAFVSGATQPGEEAGATAEGQAALEQSQAIFAAMSEDTQEWLVDLRATTIAFADSLGGSEEEAREVYERNARTYDLLCLRAIVVPPDAIAGVQERLAAGEDFGEVSTQVTTIEDLAAAGGDLGECLTVEGLVQANLGQDIVDLVANLDAGQVAGPVDLGTDETGQTLQALLEVRDRQVQPFDAVADQIMASLTGDAALATRVQEALAEADIHVDPRFGTWDGSVGSILPPDGSRVPDDLAVDAGIPTDGG